MLDDGCRSWSLLTQGSARVADVLRPHLGDVGARERGTRIAQALIDGYGDPESVANAFLPHLPTSVRRSAACRVAAAWLQVSEGW